MGLALATFHEKKMEARTSPDPPLDAIRLRGVKTHNLKNLDLTLPHRKLYVITGVSGSGKSSLAFDTLYAEGQRRYIESVSAYARQFLERMAKPDLESASGIPPALAIQAKNSITNARSTVGTQTEINDHLRVLFARAGRLRCPECQAPVEKYDPSKAAAHLIAGFTGEEARIAFQITLGKKSPKYLRENLEELERQGFSEFFYDGAWMDGAALVRKKVVLGELLVSVDLLKVGVANKERLTDSLEQAFRLGRGEAQAWVAGKSHSPSKELKVNGLPAGQAGAGPGNLSGKENGPNTIQFPHCGNWGHPDYHNGKENKSQDGGQGKVLKFSEKSRCFSCGRSFPEPSPNLFSFNSPLGACPSCQGFGRVITVDWDLVVPDGTKSIKDGAIEPWTKASTRWEQGQFLDFCQRKRIPIRVPWMKLKARVRKWILEGYPGDDFVSVREFFEYMNKRTYKMHVRIFLNRYRGYAPCETCHVTRLKTEALDFRLGREPQAPDEDVSNEQHSMLIREKNIAQVQALSIGELLKFLETLALTPEENEKVEPVREELLSRVRFLKDVGLGYLTLDRMSRTLSGGEVERIHLASSLGSALVDTLYVLDEPSIGLHERDNQMLIALLRKLRDLGNTVVVVEHDRTMIGAADCVIDLGPSGGAKGGELIFQGSVEELKRHPGSVTGEYLAGRCKLERKSGGTHFLTKNECPRLKGKIVIRGAKAHNLKSIDVEIPLGKFTVLTGVSGSGKSTFLYEILYNHFLKFKGRPVSQEEFGSVEKIRGFEPLADMVLIDQSPLGRSPRSNPATYMKAFEDIRKVFAATPEARREGFDAGHFSFNVEKGRCPACEGDGAVKVEMHFLADIFVPCEECHGKRFKPEVLEIRYQGKNVDQVLNMTVDEALDFFPASKSLFEKLSILKKIGLGYLRLGQPTLTLSGGEAQRLKLAFELSSGSSNPSLYLLDEPTTGLHEDDVRHLIRAFEELLERGHSLFVIEHHLGVIGLADHVIDLGPEGGDQGGEVVYQGPVAGLMDCERSYTGRYLKQYPNTTY
ncbi:MAG: excinuclease ABC subunit UvrA [Candidatus Omnitrophica bacterium]|nr:excinuclease ABC subunit UvrA [Candidatus Omnitrophota bacterium]